MGQDTITTGLPSQRQVSSFNTMPGLASPAQAPIDSNPLSAQGVTSQVYNKVSDAIANPNADAFGSLNALAPATLNAVNRQAQDQQASGDSTAMPMAELFDPKYALPGAAVGAGMGMGLAAVYNDQGDRIFRFIDKIPGSKLWGEKSSQLVENWIKGRSQKTQNRLNLLFNRMEQKDAEVHLRGRIDNAAAKRFGPAGEGIVQHLQRQSSGLVDLKAHIDFSAPVREGRLMRGFKHVSHSVSKLFGSEGHPPIGGLLKVDDATGEITLKNANITDAQREAIKATFTKDGFVPKDVDDALRQANKAERELFKIAQNNHFNGNYKKFSKQFRGFRSYTIGQANLMEKYADYRVLNDRLKGYNPLVRGVVKSGYYLKRAFAAESMFSSKNAANAVEKAAGKIPMAGLTGGLVGFMTFGLAFKEATKGETKKDKFKIGIREILSGTVASLALFEVGLDKGRLLGLEKLMGKFAFKGFLGTKFSWVGSAIGIGIGMVAASVIQSFMNKGFDKIFGKAKTKDDAKKAANAIPPQAAAPVTPFALKANSNMSPVPAMSAQSAQQAPAPVTPSAPVDTSAPAPVTKLEPPSTDAFVPMKRSTPKEKSSPFQMPPTSVSVDDIRRNPIADQQNMMADQIITNANKGWSDSDLIPAGMSGSEH